MTRKFYIALIICTLLKINSANAEPVISNVVGELGNDKLVTIQGSGFTIKPVAAPLFWWRADFGSPPSDLGRSKSWDGAFNGVVSSQIVAPGSQQAIAFDHGISSGAALGPVNFDSDSIYLYRKTHEAFDVAKDIALRTRFNNLSGTINIGDTVTGLTSGATGIVQSYLSNAIFYSNSGGTINDQPNVDFINGETLTTNSATMTNSESVGLLRSFNFKTVRFWSALGANNNIHVNSQGADPSIAFRITPERTDGTTFGSAFNNKMLFPLPNSWKAEEIEYKTSAIDTSDGIWNYYQNRILGTDNTFKTRTTVYPNRYALIYQSQVSNGAQSGSIMYYDSLYIDETWHRVVICKEKTWETCSNPEVQIPTQWTDSDITVSANLGGFNPKSSLYLYVVDQDGVANNKGYSLCSSCPLPPTLLSIEN